MDKNRILEEAYVPEKEWDLCYIDENGLIYRPIYNRKTGELLETGKAYYERYMASKDKPVELPVDKMEVLITRVDGLENINAGLLLENAEHQIKIQEQEKMNKEQEVTNANLLLEIAMLKQDGGGTNVV